VTLLGMWPPTPEPPPVFNVVLSGPFGAGRGALDPHLIPISPLILTLIGLVPQSRVPFFAWLEFGSPRRLAELSAIGAGALAARIQRCPNARDPFPEVKGESERGLLTLPFQIIK
jgi:hypothetical protein